MPPIVVSPPLFAADDFGFAGLFPEGCVFFWFLRFDIWVGLGKKDQDDERDDQVYSVAQPEASARVPQANSG